MAEVLDAKTKKTKPGILFFESPFKDVLIIIEENGDCVVVNAPKFICQDAVWNDLLRTKVNEIIKSL